MPWRSTQYRTRAPWRHGQGGLIALLLLVAPSALADTASASRLSLKVNESIAIPYASLTAVLSLNEAIVEVAPSPGGFTVKGKTIGETLVQAFTDTAVNVVVITVLPSPSLPPSPQTSPPLGERGPIQSFWGANQYTAQAQRSSNGDWYSLHSLDFRGRVKDGEYLASTQFFAGNFGRQLQQATIGWQNEDHTLAFDLGDTAGRVEGTSMLGAIGLKGFSARRLQLIGANRGELGYEVFVGSIRGPADPYGLRFAQPVAGAALHRLWSPTRHLRLRIGTSILGYETATTTLGPGQLGMVSGSSLRAFHDNGFAGEARGALSLTQPTFGNARGNVAFSLGATLMHGSDKGTARLELEGNQRGFAQPQGTVGMPGSNRLTASVNRRLSVLTAGASASFARVEYSEGIAGNAFSYRLDTMAPVTPTDRVTIQLSESNLVLPPTSGVAQPVPRSFRQDMVGAKLEHTIAATALNLQAELNYLGTDSGESTSKGGMAGVSMQRHRQNNWEASGTLAVSGAEVTPRKTDTIASDQPSLNVGASLSAQGRLIQGPFESFGGLGLQATAMPVARLSPSANLGVQFTPTSAHRLVGTMTLARYATGNLPWTVGLGYTHHFGDAVRARPVLEFLRVGRIEGRVCFDENQDGECSKDEPSISQVPVSLSDGRTTTTDESGHYAFDHVKPGFYSVEVDESALRKQGRPTTTLSSAFDLEPRAERTLSFGVARACRVRGHVVNDLNLDGLADANEPLFGQGMVSLSGATGTFRTRVEAQGTFAITLPCGEYDVEMDPASLPELHSLGDLVTPHVLVSPDNIPTVRLLVRAIRTLSGTVFLDGNENGQRDPGEAGLADVVVRFGKITGRTDPDGNFLLRRVPTGDGELIVENASLPSDLEAGSAHALALPPTPTAVEDIQLPVRRAR